MPRTKTTTRQGKTAWRGSVEQRRDDTMWHEGADLNDAKLFQPCNCYTWTFSMSDQPSSFVRAGTSSFCSASQDIKAKTRKHERSRTFPLAFCCRSYAASARSYLLRLSLKVACFPSDFDTRLAAATAASSAETEVQPIAPCVKPDTDGLSPRKR